jgi:amino acid permease
MTWFNSIKCFLGIGILATPSVYQKIGIVGGNIGMLVVGYISLYTMQLQVQAAA